jgi:23S rRNA (cytidine1920-2'-O)/16S rRNA (cytidine1409-2'-O)-methyltransferase
MSRIDVLMVKIGLVASRSKAQELIATERVYLIRQTTAGEIQRELVKKPSLNLTDHFGDDGFSIEIIEDPADRFVSRGGIKMQGALSRSQVMTDGVSVLDVGVSTGGFSDCLLQAGVARIVGVDVGHGQLAQKLKHESRLIHFEGINARQLPGKELFAANHGNLFDLVVIDVSFISLTLVLPEVVKYLRSAGHVLALVKPQFEVGRAGLGKGGVVKNKKLYQDVEEKIRKCCESISLNVEDYFESAISGSDGNHEFFLFAKKQSI